MENKDEDLLNDEKKLAILKKWEQSTDSPPSISELIKFAFPEIVDERMLDGRSIYGRAIKELLVKSGAKKNVKVEYKPKGDIELSEDFKVYVINNCRTMKSVEMARVLFNNPRLSPASQESRSISNFYKTLNQVVINSDDYPEEDYKGPNTVDRVVARIKKYVDDAKIWDFRKLTPTQKKNCDALMGYLSLYRFKYQIDSYEKPSDKKLFESSFIKYSYDKNDLTQENCDQYILLCSEIVTDSHIQETINMLQSEQDRVLNDEGKISMAVVEAVKTARQEHNDCVKRQQTLYKSLTQERSDKLSEEIKDKASLLNLVNLWKNESTRREMIALANERKKKLGEEIDRLESMDDLKAKIIGISRNEILEN